MKQRLRFDIPFNGFCGTTFLNCFTSVYMFLESIAVGDSDYDCPQLKGISCNSCGRCRKGGSTPISVQEQYFFLFDTMWGRSSLRCRFDSQPTEIQNMVCETDFYDGGAENNIDFLFGFAGWEYSKFTAGYQAVVKASIDASKPVIAKVKTGDNRFRVIVGYDGDKLLCPDYNNAQKPPKKAPKYDELEALYIFGEKILPRYTLTDGLERIVQIMQYNLDEKLWDGYIEKMGLYTADSLSKCSPDEKKARMKRVAETMWRTFSCHNFAEVFRKYRDEGNPAIYDGISGMSQLRNSAMKELWNNISDPCYGYTHDLAWALIGLEECADWKKHAAGYFGEMVELTLCQIKKNDEAVLEAIKSALELLRK